MQKILVKTDRNGTKYYKCSDTCDKCHGTGFLKYYAYIENGECFDCNGTGIYEWEEKEYTPEYEKKQAERRERLLAKKKAEEEANASKLNAEFLKSNGFNEEGITYFILGDTYKVKDDLKAQGAKWDKRTDHWHIDHKIEGFDLIEVSVDEMYYKNLSGVYHWSNGKSVPEDKNEDHYIYKIELAEESRRIKIEGVSEYVGNIGEKLEVEATYVFNASYKTSFYGRPQFNYIYNFKDENGNVFVWKTTSFMDLDRGIKVKVTGVVKEHSEYNEVKQTVLKNCKVTAL